MTKIKIMIGKKIIKANNISILIIKMISILKNHTNLTGNKSMKKAKIQ